MRLLEFVMTSTLIEMTPGPNMSYLAAIAMARGARPAIRAVLGVATGLALVGGLVILGLTQFLEEYPRADAVLRWCGVFYMLWLAIETWREAGKTYEGTAASEYGSFWRGLTTNLLNPKLVVFYVAVLPDFIDTRSGNPMIQTLTLVAVYTGIATLVHLCIIGLASRFREFIAAGDTKRIGRIMACLLLGVALWLFLEIKVSPG